jgi:hypothetical protein
MWLAGLALALFVACGASATWAQTGNPSNDAMISRNPAGQRDAIRSIVTQNRFACTEVTNLFAAGLDSRRTAYWDASCREGGSWRVAFPSDRWAPAQITVCGQGGSPAGGPCFRPLAATAAVAEVAPASVPPACRQSCSSQPAAVQNACLQRCASGNTIQAAAPAAGAMVGRFGFIYAAEPPSTAFGFTSGMADRLAASMAAIRACEAVVGRNQCRITLDFPNACGALAQALTSGPTQVRRITTGVGQTREQAEAQAMNSCRLTAAASASMSCRIAQSGC